MKRKHLLACYKKKRRRTFIKAETCRIETSVSCVPLQGSQISICQNNEVIAAIHWCMDEEWFDLHVSSGTEVVKATIEITSLTVNSSHRHRALATRLIHDAAQHIAHKNAKFISLFDGSDVQGEENIYRKCGFTDCCGGHCLYPNQKIALAEAVLQKTRNFLLTKGHDVNKQGFFLSQEMTIDKKLL